MMAPQIAVETATVQVALAAARIHLETIRGLCAPWESELPHRLAELAEEAEAKLDALEGRLLAWVS